MSFWRRPSFLPRGYLSNARIPPSGAGLYVGLRAENKETPSLTAAVVFSTIFQIQVRYFGFTIPFRDRLDQIRRTLSALRALR